jgi:hypothetical protein
MGSFELVAVVGLVLVGLALFSFLSERRAINRVKARSGL